MGEGGKGEVAIGLGLTKGVKSKNKNKKQAIVKVRKKPTDEQLHDSSNDTFGARFQ